MTESPRDTAVGPPSGPGAATPVYVAVVGGSAAGESDCRAAAVVGGALAAAGAIVVCGGLGGVMEAACRAAKVRGGTTLAILGGDDRSEANPWVDIAVPTGLGEARNALVVRSAHAVIAVGGEYGTLSEIALALRAGKPVVGVATWELRPPHPLGNGIVQVDDPADAVPTALGLI